MAYQAIFQRYEMKYMLTREQKRLLLKVMAPYMALDRYGRTTICNLYYDTDSYRLIRRSLEKPAYKPSQITAEIDYVRGYYEDLRPVVFLSYEREAFFMRDGGDFRVTFDENILCREDHLTLTESAWGSPILPEGMTLMELKTSGGIPLWMTRFLTEHHIYKTSFSKYGTAYQSLIFPEKQHQKEGERKYA